MPSRCSPHRAGARDQRRAGRLGRQRHPDRLRLGLFLLVSLADLVENRRLVLTLCHHRARPGRNGHGDRAVAFFVSAFVIGLCSTGAQVLIPLMAHLIPPSGGAASSAM